MTIDTEKWYRVTSEVTGIGYDFAEEADAKAWEARLASIDKARTKVETVEPTYPRTDLKKVRAANGLYLIGPVAVDRICEDWSCGCERYAIRPRLDDGTELGDLLSTYRLLKDALAAAETFAREVAK